MTSFKSSLQFFCLKSWVVSYYSCIARFAYFSSLNFLSFECLWTIRFLICGLRKTTACLRVTYTAQILINFVVFVEIYLGKRHWKKKSIQPRYILCFSLIFPKICSVYILARYAWNAIFWWIRPQREKASFCLKHTKTGVHNMNIPAVGVYG